MRELDDTFTVGPVVAVRYGARRVVGEEVEVEIVVGEFLLFDQVHAEVFVEFHGGFGVFHPSRVALASYPSMALPLQ